MGSCPQGCDFFLWETGTGRFDPDHFRLCSGGNQQGRVGAGQGQANLIRKFSKHTEKRELTGLDLKDGNRKLQGQKLALEPRGKS